MRDADSERYFSPLYGWHSVQLLTERSIALRDDGVQVYEVWGPCFAERKGHCAITSRSYPIGEELFRPLRGSRSYWPAWTRITLAAVRQLPIGRAVNMSEAWRLLKPRYFPTNGH